MLIAVAPCGIEKFAFAELLLPQRKLDTSASESKPQWTVRTQRQPKYEKLTLVKSEGWVPDAREVKNMTQPGGADEEGMLIIKYPNVPQGFLTPLHRFFNVSRSHCVGAFVLSPPPKHSYPSEEIVLWRDKPRSLNYGIHVPVEFKSWLGITSEFALFRVDPSAYRQVMGNAPQEEELGYQPSVGFADAYHLHLLNLASIRDFAAKFKGDIPRLSARRFRGNIIVTGPAAYGGDDWKKVRIGQQNIFHFSCDTVRCRLPKLDPESSERHPTQPDKRLKATRCIDDGYPLSGCLGLQLVPGVASGIHIKIGDSVELLERGEHHYIPQ